MTPVPFADVNLTLCAAEGETEEVSDMPVARLNGGFLSAWQADTEELAEIARTGLVYLFIAQDPDSPPPPVILSAVNLIEKPKRN